MKDGIGTIGITDYAQHELGDVVFVELPKVGAKVEAGKSFGTVESVKAVSEIYAPVSGVVTEINGDLHATPETINSDPHGAAWLIKMYRRRSGGSGEIDGCAGLRSLYRGGKKRSLGLMRYLPKSPDERKEMLAVVGARSIDELFRSIPEQYRLKKALNLPGPFSEAEIIQYFKERAGENSLGYTQFSGCGCLQPSALGYYRHDYSARRISDFLYAVSGGNYARHAAGDF